MVFTAYRCFLHGGATAANILTRLVTREGWHGLYLRPKFKHRWKVWLAAWFGPGLITIFGVAVFFLVFPQYFDPQIGKVKEMLSAMGDSAVPASLQNPWLLMAFLTLRSMVVFSLVNGLFAFGEEFGWRAYLLQKMLLLGWRKAMLLMGVIWGAWHWPLIAMGHNYGTDYAGFPWAGMLMMVVFTFSSGVFLSWAALRGGSVWPAVLAHGAINGVARLFEVMAKGEPSLLVGPGGTGILGMSGYILVAMWLFFRYKSEENRSMLIESPEVPGD